jgi:hypothetical protein
MVPLAILVQEANKDILDLQVILELEGKMEPWVKRDQLVKMAKMVSKD